MKDLQLFLFLFVPFMILMLGSAEIYKRNPGSAMNRLAAALLLTNAVFYLGDILLQTVSMNAAAGVYLYVKIGAGFINMSVGIYFLQELCRSPVRPVWYQAGALLPLIGLVCIGYGGSWFGTEVQQETIWRTVKRSDGLNLLIVASTLYSFATYYIHLWLAFRRLKSKPWLVQERANVTLFMKTCLAMVLWLVLCPLLFTMFPLSSYLQLHVMMSYANMFFCWAIWYAMVHYDFLSAPEKRYKLLFRESGHGIVIFDENWRFVDANPAYLRMIGIEDDADMSWKGASYTDYIRLEGFLFSSEEIKRRWLEKTPYYTELRLTNRSEQSFDINVQIHFFEMEGQIGAHVTVYDITAQKKNERQLLFQANHDPLTRLANRRRFYEKLDEVLRRQERSDGMLAVFLIDLDQFKWINDTLGHYAGDELLLSVSDRLRETVPEYGCVARLGGDEFGVLLPGMQTEYEADAMALELINKLRPAYAVMDQPLQVTASIGISIGPRDGIDAETLVRNADMAMYRSKSNGRDRYMKYVPALSDTAEKTLVLVNGLRTALEHNEFELHYQPQIDLQADRIIGVEALLRWHSPKLGHVSPADFIPMAEETGAIVPIGEWVLRSAVAQGKQWLESGRTGLVMSVNLSARQFREPRLADRLTELLQEYDFPAGNLCLEITESTAIDYLEQTLAVCQEIVRLGVRLSIDDFGTGYSSLGMLSRFPFHTVKIDRSLIRDIDTDRKDAAVFRTIMSLSRRLGMEVLAEGVETEAQLDLLKRFRCHQAQGYLYGRPMPAEGIDALLLESGEKERETDGVL
ncbi:putative bifunctional diguanylate cyclase/phosphodiesterase [Cohnella suwonensis]|uniref:Bifunctional diguanylate cyclase/phosphodiesterase n=1 Tax=Cohnella suwonensis TaxID=696072 RepID=A0ABW0M0T7_9BACL